MNSKIPIFFAAILLLITLVCGQVPAVFAQSAGNPFDSLTKGKMVNGFRADAVYLDDSDKPIGGRFVHVQTGFTLDLLQIQSVPQAYIWTNTFTVSDMGEPHTQEHLLIGKGNKGRNINVLENMSLTQSNASTYQTYTNYQFNTAGSAEVFYRVFAEYMDVLLHPDYTEEEVRREVRNWGVTENPDKSLRLEEKGSVYNEMTSSMNNPDWRIYDNSPDKTLADLDKVRKRLLNVGNARMFYIGSTANRQKLEPAFNDLLTGFDTAALLYANYVPFRRIEERLAQRSTKGFWERPVYVGLMAPNMSGGVIMNSASLTSYSDTGQDKILDFLAAKLYGGGGAHSVFSKTIGAGLAYSNGISSNPATGLMGYYAERTPEMPQTLRFAMGEVKRSMDTPLTEYVISLSFSSRASSPYEARGEIMASNMADGVTPETVARFRRAILEARKVPSLSAELYKRKDRVYERVFPGYGVKGKDVAGSNFFVIGPEKQMATYEAYLKSVEGPDAKLYRLYPRDFWMVVKN